MPKGRLIVLSGPSGVGKGTVYQELFRRRPDMRFSVSATTRAPREGERDGVDYHFIDRGRYDALIAEGAFLEYATVHGNYYGTLRREVAGKLDQGDDVLLDIDIQGGLQVIGSGTECLSIFVLPPSIAELRRRLSARATETQESLALRMSNALGEIEAASRYRYAVVNRRVKECVDDIEAILEADAASTPESAAHFETTHIDELIARLKEEVPC